MLPLGNCMGMPMLTVGIRRYTTKANRGFAFGIFYSVMNVGAFVSGPVIDILNIHVKNVDIFNYNLSGNRLVILTTTLSSCISFMVTLLFLREIRVTENENFDEKDQEEAHEDREGEDTSVMDKTGIDIESTTTSNNTSNSSSIEMTNNSHRRHNGNDLTYSSSSGNMSRNSNEKDRSSSSSFLSVSKTDSMCTDMTVSTEYHEQEVSSGNDRTTFNPMYTQGESTSSSSDTSSSIFVFYMILICIHNKGPGLVWLDLRSLL
jgi:hypothetical protein